MKKYLLSLFLVFAVFLGHSQIILNEVYNNPGSGNNEFFELYNTSFQTLNVDCYTLVIYYKASSNNSDRGFIVLNLPSRNIGPKGFLTGASANPFAVQGQTGLIPNFVWSALGTGTGQDATGYIKDYKVNNALTAYANPAIPSTATGENTSMANIFKKLHSSGDLAVFLFNGSTYVNGLTVGMDVDNTLPQQIIEMPKLENIPITGTGCNAATFTIDWTTIPRTEFSTGGGSGGNDNGFARDFDGSCGSWVKTSSQDTHTPGVPNGSATGEGIIGLTTSESRLCDNKISFVLSGAANSNSLNTLPVKAHLYFENVEASYGTLDATDVLMETITVNSFSTTPQTFITAVPLGQRVLIAYETILGCFDKVIAPTIASGELITSTKDICGTSNRIDFTLTGATGNISSYVLPITVEMYYDINGNGNLDNEELTKIDQKVITSFSSVAQTFTNPNPDSKVILVYKTAQNCFNKTEPAQPTIGALNTTENYICNNRLRFTIPSGTTSDATTYGLPVNVMVYNVATGELMGSKTVTTFSTLADYIDLIPADWNTTTVRVEYKSTNDCFSKIVSGPAKVPTGNITLKAALPTTTTVSYSIDNTTASDAYSFVITVYEDRNNNGRGDADEPVLNNHTINTAPPANTTFSATLQDTKYNAVVEAKSTVGCSQATLLLAPAKPLPVKLVSFTAKRNKEKVHLTWETSMEQNNSGFDIQRKVGNGEWKTIAFMFSQANGGNSNSVLRYEYNDVNPAKGVSQYRLRQVDIDTRSTLSEIRSVRGLEQASQSLVYPNPSIDGKVNIIFDDHISRRTISISDLTGRVIKQYQNVVDNALLIDGLQDGIYTLQITNTTTGETSVQKVVIKKR